MTIMTNHLTSWDHLSTQTFSPRLLSWFWQYGRHDLPWQQHQKSVADIYAVWLSEVMLQQTQVVTVIGYFNRFIQTFPTVHDLAQASWDEVALLWAGLGYYARARNLHAGAKQVVAYIQMHGNFPQTTLEWQNIKGVGRSTAGAIVAMGVKGYGVICDGNVKRVLTRWAAIDADITKSATDKLLWDLADRLTPNDNSGHFAQAMMDLGATVCTRTKPNCSVCPLSKDCLAYAQAKPTAYPVKSKKAAKPHRYSLAFIIKHQEQILWLKRQGDKRNMIWEGLWCLPLLGIEPTIDEMFGLNQDDIWHHLTHELCVSQAQFSEQQLFERLLQDWQHCHVQTGHTIKHTLTHFYWHLGVVYVSVDARIFEGVSQALTAAGADFVWQDGKTLGMPTAIKKLLSDES